MSSEYQDNPSNSDVIQVTIHHCENLKTKMLLLQPVVFIHVIDAKSGTYLKKSVRSRAVVSFYENQRNDVDYIMPVMTQPCSITRERKLSWEEIFIFNEEYSIFFHSESSVILFFEVIDLAPISHSKFCYERLNQYGMHKIAWAFLKLLGSNGILNTGPQLRLQLFKPLKPIIQKKILDVEVYKWWLKKARTPIEASLIISIEPHSTFIAEPVLRSMLPFQQEIGSTTFEKLSESNTESGSTFPELYKSSFKPNQSTEIIWSRKKGELCKIPRQKVLLLNTLSSCQIIKFSTNGRFLSAGCGNIDSYYVILYKIPNGKLLHKILAHSELIYDLDWSHTDKYLLSASGDYSVKMWDTKHWILKETFVHPSYVYNAKFHPKHENLFASSCHDHLIRIWTLKKCQLLKELEAHSSTVCTLCWNASGTKLYSADGIGQIKIWGNFKQDHKETIHLESCRLKNEINPLETKGIAINKIVLDPQENALCLFCSDSIARILCLQRGCILDSYESDLSAPKLSKGCCSPCGSLFFLCCDKGKVTVWNKSIAKSEPELIYDLNYGSISSIDYHPYEHAVAFSFWEESIPIHIYAYDKIGQEKKEFAYYGPADIGTYEKIYPLKQSPIPKNCTFIKTNIDISTKIKHKMHNPTKYKAQESEETSFTDLNGMQDKSLKGSLTAVITKSGQFAIIAVPDESTSDNNTFRDLNKEPVVLNRSSKRSQRRRKLREMNKSLVSS